MVLALAQVSLGCSCRYKMRGCKLEQRWFSSKSPQGTQTGVPKLPIVAHRAVEDVQSRWAFRYSATLLRLSIGPGTMRLVPTSAALLLAAGSVAHPLATTDQAALLAPAAVAARPRPLVIWYVYPPPLPLFVTCADDLSRHGLGDTAHAEGISEFIEEIKAVHPGIFVHSVQIPEDGSLDDERKAGFVGLTSPACPQPVAESGVA